MAAAPVEISTATAARLLGVSYEMVRRLAAAGHIAVHRRGHTTVRAAVAGYATFLRADAQRAETNVSAVRAHQARAARTAALNARRRADLVEIEDVELLLDHIVTVATDALRGLDLRGQVTDGTHKRLKVAATEAATEVQQARDLALAVLRGEATYD